MKKVIISSIFVFAWIGLDRVATDIDQMIMTIVDSTGLILGCIFIFAVSYLTLMALE